MAAVTLLLRFADSEVAAVEAVAGGVSIRLSAAQVEQAGAAPGDKPVAGYARGVVLWFDGAAAPAPDALFGRIAAGRIHLGGTWRSTVPLPLSHCESIELELSFANRSQLTLSARGLDGRFDGEPNFAESLAC
jgi:hypothetical protein